LTIFPKCSQRRCWNINLFEAFASFAPFVPFSLLTETTMSYFIPTTGYCFFCSTIYALLHQDYLSNWLQLQQYLILYSKTHVTICLRCYLWCNP